MSENQRVGDLEINQDMNFQRWEWRFQQVGGLILLLIVIAGLLGFLGGDGPFSTASVSSDGGSLRLEYDRFEHFMNWTEMRLYPQQTDFTLWIDRDFAEMMNIDHLNPEFESAGSDGKRLTYQFTDFEPGEPITFYFRFSRFGMFNGQMGIEGGETLTFPQIIYP